MPTRLSKRPDPKLYWKAGTSGVLYAFAIFYDRTQRPARKWYASGITDRAAAEILASGLTADRDTMLADLATQQAVDPTTTTAAPARSTGRPPTARSRCSACRLAITA